MAKYKPWRAVIAILHILISLWNTIKEEKLPSRLGGLAPNKASENLKKKTNPFLPDSKCRFDCSVPVLHAWRADRNLWERWWTPSTSSIFSSAVLTPWSLRETRGVEKKNLLQSPSSGLDGKNDVIPIERSRSFQFNFQLSSSGLCQTKIFLHSFNYKATCKGRESHKRGAWKSGIRWAQHRAREQQNLSAFGCSMSPTHRDKHFPVVFLILTVVTGAQQHVLREGRSQVSGKRWGTLRKISLSKRFREKKELNGFMLSHLIAEALRDEGHAKATWQDWGLSPWLQAQDLNTFLPK